MQRNGLIWGLALIVLGVLLLLNTLGILNVDVGGLVCPGLMIFIGLSVLWGALVRPKPGDEQQLSIPLEGANTATVRVGFGAGDLSIKGDVNPAEILNGTFSGGVEHEAQREGESLNVRLQSSQEEWMTFPWMVNIRREWNVALNEQIPLRLEVDAGASNSRIDLSNLKVADLRLKIGASNSDVTMPANAGHTMAIVQAGAASVQIRIPSGVAARIQFRGGAASFEADPARFPRSGSYRQSPDYDTASNKIDLQVDAGAGSITVV